MGGRGVHAHDDNAQIKMAEHLRWLEIKDTKEIWDDYRAACSRGTGGCVGNQAMRKKCVCCMQYSLPAFSEYEQCPVCDWIDDPIQNQDITSTSGCNPISLQEARKMWATKNQALI